MKKYIIATVVGLLCIVGLAKVCSPASSSPQDNQAQKSKVEHKNKKAKPKKTKSQAELARPYKDPKDLRKAGSWKSRSEKKKYPDISDPKKVVLRVSLKGNRVYVLKNGKVAYTMLSTAGVYKHGKSATPTGTYRIQEGRGESFFNQGLNEGANNWVSWDPEDANVYLFHSVPTTALGDYNLKEAKKLGRTQGSHGCIRLSVPDSRWLMEHAQPGTKVIIKDK